MKVTVCFGAVRVVVPCGTGDLLVKDLVPEAVRRYKKAAGKEPDTWVVVHHLQTQSGILDPDDRLRDVADDREQILASFEDTGPDPCVPQGGGDGASGSSSVGTGSPDIFRDPTNTVATTGHNVNSSTPHIEVTSTTVVPHSGVGLQVRRSSDPNLLQTLKNQSETTKRWSAAAPACGHESPDRVLDKVNYLAPQWEEEDDLPNPFGLSPQAFARSGRLSMQFLGDGNGYKWIEAAERLANQTYATKSLPRETSKRKEPLGQAHESIREKDGEMLLIINEYGGPLGLTAVPDRENGGLIVQSVEPGSRAERGRLRRGDRILEINGTKLIGMAESKVQEHLRRSLATSELRVRVIRAEQMVPKSRRENSISEMIEAEEKSSGAKIATVSPTRKLPGAVAGTSLQVANTRKLGRKIEIILKKGPHGLGFSVTTRDNPAGGHCPIYIKNILPKGAAIEDGRLKPGDRLLEVDGLPMTGKTQSEVVSILRSTQPGATVRIIVSRQQELEEEREVALQNFPEEQEDVQNIPPKPPAPIPPPISLENRATNNTQEINDLQISVNLNDQHFIDAGSESAASSDSLQAGIAWRNREVLTLHIPVHDTEKAGLGVSVKGKTSSANSSSSSNGSIKHDGDLGIFVKSVLHGGAASRDGRLRTNDQLLSVNGISLLGQNNAEAMETLRRAMLHTSGKHPGVITLSVARKISRSHSSSDILDSHDSSNASETSGATVIYLSPDKKDSRDCLNRWSNPVLDRLTGGVCPPDSADKRHTPLFSQNLRNESYYKATNDTWSPSSNQMNKSNATMNDSILIEEESEPLSPIFPSRGNDSVSTQHSSSNTNPDITYASQLSLETNTSVEAFSRDAVGRRSISEKHHAALDARETGTYQRNKKLREERERERRLQLTKSVIISGSVESLTRVGNSTTRTGIKNLTNGDLKLEALDTIGDLGPSLGLKKSSSLESLQTMVQEIQMSDETRGPTALRAPRGRGREDGLRAAVVGGSDINKPRKHWLLEDTADPDGGFVNRNGPFQSSLNEGKHKSRAKKPGILKGIGHMFRFGKHRKDGVVPVETTSDFGGVINHNMGNVQQQQQQQSHSQSQHIVERPKCGPPTYQPPPPPSSSNNGGIHQNDIFNHRYQHYVNYDELQQQIRGTTSDELSQSVIECMRAQVMRQRTKVELESRRHQHYHSQRSTRNQDIHTQQHQHSAINRPISSYYEYETVQHNVSSNPPRKTKPTASPPRHHWKAATINGFGPHGGSGRSRRPFVTQVTIRDQTHPPQPQTQLQQQQSQQHQQHHQIIGPQSVSCTSSSSSSAAPIYQQVQKQHQQHSANSSYHHQITQQPHASKV